MEVNAAMFMCWLYCDIDKRCCFLFRSEHILNRHTENISSLLCKDVLHGRVLHSACGGKVETL